MEHFLLAIIPSEDIVIKIRNLRTSFFKEFGLISSRCLPVMIPVAFSVKAINKSLFSDIQLTKPLTTSNEALVEQQNIFLKITQTDIIDRIVETLSSYEKKGFISTGKGFYIGTNENSLDNQEILNHITVKSKNILKWKKNNLKLIKIKTNNKNWWESITWETIWSLKLKNNYYL